jgi:hypothetical protein
MYGRTGLFRVFFQCAMEENCLASEAYRLRAEGRHDYSMETRRLLRSGLPDHESRNKNL